MYINFRECLVAYKVTRLGGVSGGEGSLTAQRDVRRKKTKKGWGRGESKGTPVRLFNKSLFRYTRFWYTL